MTETRNSTPKKPKQFDARHRWSWAYRYPLKRLGLRGALRTSTLARAFPDRGLTPSFQGKYWESGTSYPRGGDGL